LHLRLENPALRATLAPREIPVPPCSSPSWLFRFPLGLNRSLSKPSTSPSITAPPDRAGINSASTVYASIGGGTTPQIFELDTGGAGLFAAYASADTNKSSDNPYLRIGLTAADTTSASAFCFGMNTNTNAPPGATFTNSGSPFYSEQVFNANMTISNATANLTVNLGITTDTGASTTIHNEDLGGVPGKLLVTNHEGKVHLVSEADFGLSGPTVGGTNAGFYQFVTSNDQVSIQNNKPGNSNIFYLNSGIELFKKYDVIYNLQDGQISFEPVPEPRTWALLAVSAAALAFLRRRC